MRDLTLANPVGGVCDTRISDQIPAKRAAPRLAGRAVPPGFQCEIGEIGVVGPGWQPHACSECHWELPEFTGSLVFVFANCV